MSTTWNSVDKSDPMPRYLQVRRIVEDSIYSGKFAPGERLPGERELAVDLNVSQMTVNKAIQALVQDGWLRREVGNGTFVREEFQLPRLTEARIGFAVPSSVQLVTGDYYVGSLFRGIQRAIIGEPVSLSLIETPESGLYESLMASSMDGFLLTDPPEEVIPDLQRLAAERRKMLILGGAGDLEGVPFVDADNAGGTRQAIDHLVNLGHTRIAGVFAYMDKSDSRQRRQAYRQAMFEHGIAANTYCIEYRDDGEGLQAARDQMRDLLRWDDGPTAFFCGGYYVALETIKVVQQHGRVVPDEISIVGFDDPGTAGYLTPPLTTVSQPLEDMGYQAMQRLMKWLLRNEKPQQKDVLPTTFVARSSTAKPGGSSARREPDLLLGDRQ